MPKIVGHIARVRAPKVGERSSVFHRLFSRARPAIQEPVVKDDGRLKIMERYVKDNLNEMAMEHGRQQHSEGVGKQLNDDEVLRGMAEEMYDRIYDPKRNGMMSRRMDVGQDVIEDYVRWTESKGFDEEMEWMKSYGRSPFEYYLDLRRPDLYAQWIKAAPVWEGYGRAGEVPKRRVRRYERIWDGLSDSEKDEVSAFARRNGLPIHSAVQMLSPEFYKFMKKTGTPFLRMTQDGRIVTESKNISNRLGDIFELNDESGFGVEYEMPYVRGKHQFGVSDLKSLDNNVQFVGNDYADASRVVNSGAEGWRGGNGYINPGVWYGSWSNSKADTYARSPVGAVHRIVVGGKPMIGENHGGLHRIMVDGAKTYDRMIGEIGNVDRFIDPERLTPDDLDYVRGLGYDYYGDFGIENQFVDNRPNFVKSLVGNVGSFSTRSNNWYKARGGTVESTKDMAHLARLFGIDRKNDKIFRN